MGEGRGKGERIGERGRGEGRERGWEKGEGRERGWEKGGVTLASLKTDRLRSCTGMR